MKRQIFVLLLGVVLQTSLSAQNIVIGQSDNSSAICQFNLENVDLSTIQTAGQSFTNLSFDGSTPSVKLGTPNLPIFSQIVEVPLCADVKVTVSQVRTKSLGPVAVKHPVVPVQPSPSKSDTSPLPFVMDSALYATDSFYALPASWVEKLGVARDRNLIMLRVSPVSYNPVSGEIQVISSMTITLTYREADMASTQRMHSLYYSPDYSVGHNVLSVVPATKEIRRAAPLHYLIVSHSSFRDQLDTFINWKKRQGFIVSVAYTDDEGVGTTNTSIANCIKSYYTHATEELPAPTYLLLVGDIEQIPAFFANCGSPAESPTAHVTDLYYACWTEGDHIPDCYYGRFSARNVAELTPQIEKTIYYERYDFDDDSYLNRGVLIAGVDRRNPGDNAYKYADPAMDYMASYYINAPHGFTDVYYYKNNTSFAPTGVTVTGSSHTSATENALRQLYNQGCGWINYSAHGFDNEWSIPRFTNEHVAAMSNNNMPSFMIGNCCLSGKFNSFNYDCCFGEALLRKEGKAGAVAYIGGTNSTYWGPDFCWSVGVRTNISNTMNTSYDTTHLGMYDRLFHTHGEPFSAWHTTAGSMITAGNMAVETYGVYSYYYWEIYELFGDPSLMPWLGAAPDMVVEAPSVIGVGTPAVSVTTVPYAYVALTTSEEHDFISAAYADANGVATLEMPDDLETGIYELVVWAQNYKPYFQDVEVVVLDGPFAVITDIQPALGHIAPGCTTAFNVTVVNIGNQPTAQGTIVLESAFPGVVTAQPQVTLPAIAPGDTLVISDVWFSFFSEELNDQAVVRFNASANFGDLNSFKHMRFIVVAPKLSIVQTSATPLLMSDSSSTVLCRVVNKGHASTGDLTFSLVDHFGFTTGNIPSLHVGDLLPDSSCLLSFPLTMASDIPNTNIPFVLQATDGETAYNVGEILLRANVVEIEDFETGDFSRFNWAQGSNPWVITSTNPLAGQYSARSAMNQPNQSESRFSIFWNSTLDDSISFYYKVSSEEGYDMFKFLIDGLEVESASGECDWNRVSFPVSAGTHNFAFSYSKDYYSTEGSDCAWVDNIHLPFGGQVCLMVSDTVCKGADYTFADGTVSTDHVGVVHDHNTIDGHPAYLSLYVVDQPEVQIEVLGTPHLGECVLLKAIGADTYQWSTGDTADCIVVCPGEGSRYSVTGCRHECCNTHEVVLLGIDQPQTVSPLTLHPNPASDRVTLSAPHIQSVQLINLMGQVVIQQRVDAPTHTLSLQNLPKGVYFVRVETGISVSTEKLIVK